MNVSINVFLKNTCCLVIKVSDVFVVAEPLLVVISWLPFSTQCNVV